MPNRSSSSIRTASSSNSVVRPARSTRPIFSARRRPALPSRGEEDGTAAGGRRLDLVLRDAGSLALPYWRSAERWRARALLAVIIVLNLGIVGTSIVFIYWQKIFYNALEAKDW